MFLPNVIIKYIFTFLPEINKYYASRVCKRWHMLINLMRPKSKYKNNNHFINIIFKYSNLDNILKYGDYYVFKKFSYLYKIDQISFCRDHLLYPYLGYIKYSRIFKYGDCETVNKVALKWGRIYSSIFLNTSISSLILAILDKIQPSKYVHSINGFKVYRIDKFDFYLKKKDILKLYLKNKVDLLIKFIPYMDNILRNIYMEKYVKYYDKQDKSKLVMLNHITDNQYLIFVEHIKLNHISNLVDVFIDMPKLILSIFNYIAILYGSEYYINLFKNHLEEKKFNVLIQNGDIDIKHLMPYYKTFVKKKAYFYLVIKSNNLKNIMSIAKYLHLSNDYIFYKLCKLSKIKAKTYYYELYPSLNCIKLCIEHKNTSKKNKKYLSNFLIEQIYNI